jgi:hypothetical protein
MHRRSLAGGPSSLGQSTGPPRAGATRAGWGNGLTGAPAHSPLEAAPQLSAESWPRRRRARTSTSPTPLPLLPDFLGLIGEPQKPERRTRGRNPDGMCYRLDLARSPIDLGHILWVLRQPKKDQVPRRAVRRCGKSAHLVRLARFRGKQRRGFPRGCGQARPSSSRIRRGDSRQRAAVHQPRQRPQRAAFNHVLMNSQDCIL